MTGLTIIEASKLTGISVSTLRNHACRGVSKLGKAFSKDKHGYWRANRRHLLHAACEFKKDHSDRSKKIGARFDAAEEEKLAGLADKAGLTKAEWIRKRSLTKGTYEPS